MQHTCRNRLFIHLQISQNDRYPQRMDDIWFSGFPALISMRLYRQLISLFNHRNICGRMILSDTGN